MSTVAKAHGMDGTLVEPDWPPLALDEVRALLAQFQGCGEPIEILTVSPRPFSAASVVSTKSGRVFIKRHHRTVRDVEGLLEEHRFLRFLHAHGAAVPRVLAAASGETAIEAGDWTYEVHETPACLDLYEDALSWTPFRSAMHGVSFPLRRANRAHWLRASQSLPVQILRERWKTILPQGRHWQRMPRRATTASRRWIC